MALKPKNDKPNAAARGQMTAKLVAMGFRGSDLANIIKANRTRSEMATDLAVFLKKAPKKP